jgi:hypothetical protein
LSNALLGFGIALLKACIAFQSPGIVIPGAGIEPSGRSESSAPESFAAQMGENIFFRSF